MEEGGFRGRSDKCKGGRKVEKSREGMGEELTLDAVAICRLKGWNWEQTRPVQPQPKKFGK